MKHWQSLASPTVSVPSTLGKRGTSTSCSDCVPWDSSSQLPAVQCHHHLSLLADLSGVSHESSTRLAFPVPTSSLLQPPAQSELPANLRASPTSSTPITSLRYLFPSERRPRETLCHLSSLEKGLQMAQLLAFTLSPQRSCSAELGRGAAGSLSSADHLFYCCFATSH